MLKKIFFFGYITCLKRSVYDKKKYTVQIITEDIKKYDKRSSY